MKTRSNFPQEIQINCLSQLGLQCQMREQQTLELILKF